MNTIRMIAIALPMTLLIACGGGGGGGTAAAPTMMNPDTPMVMLEDLPTAPINAVEARELFMGSTEPTAMESNAIQEAFRSIASATGVMVIPEGIFEIGGSAGDLQCTGVTCTGTLSDGTGLEYSFDEFGSTPEIGGMALEGFNDEYSLVMTYQGVTLAQGVAAGRLGSTSYEFLNYGGWVTNSAFGIQFEEADGSGNDDLSYITAYSFGVPSTSNPSVVGVVQWDGAMVGRSTQTGDFIQGRLLVQIAADDPNSISTFAFNNVTNLNTGATMNTMGWGPLRISDGSFESSMGGELKGRFYTNNEVGGTFNSNNIIGAFGGVRR